MIQRKKLGEIANISAGQGAPQGAENYSEEGTPFVKAGDLFYLVNGERECDIQKVSEEVAKNHRLKLYPKGTVLFAKSGMSCMKGYVYATNAECYVVSHLACIMPFDVDSKYLKYYFEYHKPNQLVKDASYPSISLADIAEMPINVFDDQTEAKIVDNLDAVNSLIAKSKEELGLLDNIVKSRFVEMFGDCVINQKHWKTRFLEDIAEVGSSKRVFVEELQETGIPFYRGTEVGALAEGKPIDPELFITEEHYNKLCEATGKPQIGDLLMPSICPDGRIWVVNTDKPFYFKDGRVLWVHSVISGYNPVFLLYTLKDRIMSDYNSIASGTTFAELKIFALKKCRVFEVPLELQNRFAAFVAEVDKSKLSYEMEVAA